MQVLRTKAGVEKMGRKYPRHVLGPKVVFLLDYKMPTFQVAELCLACQKLQLSESSIVRFDLSKNVL